MIPEDEDEESEEEDEDEEEEEEEDNEYHQEENAVAKRLKPYRQSEASKRQQEQEVVIEINTASHNA